MSVAIIADSSSDIPKDIIEKYNFSVIPLYVIFGSETYKDDGKQLTIKAFYDKIRKSPTLPTTSQPTPGDFLEIYKELLKTHDSIINILISKKMSGTIASAELAARELPGADITIIDSEKVHMPCGFIAIKAAQMAATGASKEEILRKVEEMKETVNELLIPSTLEYLKKGGRIGRAKALMASLLEIKPILTLHDGEVSPYKNTRRWEQGKQEIINLMETMIKNPQKLHVFVGDSDMKTEGDEFASKIKNKFNPQELIRGNLGPVVGSHAGPGTLAATFYED
ncbi:MAG: DegV family protein [Actinobacteria bacterium]|nr:DegV family protein [Actinomycetota bacterium]